jgi:peptidoglycan/xylan/chitin deacetylase (PgdA/CDA1 family)
VFGLQSPSVILCYHAISSDGWFHAVTATMFQEQIRLLRDNGYHFLSLSDLNRHLRERSTPPHPFCVVTFDDGYEDVLSVKSFLKEEGIKPAIFVLAETEKVSPAGIGTNRPFMRDEDIHALAQDGWDIGCHGATHRPLSRASFETLQHEIIHAREMLKKRLNLPIDFFAYPFGSYEYTASSFVRRGEYQAALSMDDSLSISRGKIWRLPRIGINGTYPVSEFHDALSPLSILFRKLMKIVL